MPRLVVSIPGRQPQPFRFNLNHPPMVIGRNKQCDVYIDDASISQRHCQVRRVAGGYILEDLKSTNGVKLNGVKMGIVDLFPGVAVRVGDAEILLDFEASELAVLEVEPRRYMGIKLEDMQEEQVLAKQENSQDSSDEEEKDDEEQEEESVSDIPELQPPHIEPLGYSRDTGKVPVNDEPVIVAIKPSVNANGQPISKESSYSEKSKDLGEPIPQKTKLKPIDQDLDNFASKTKKPLAVYNKPKLITIGFLIWLIILVALGAACGVFLKYYMNEKEKENVKVSVSVPLPSDVKP